MSRLLPLLLLLGCTNSVRGSIDGDGVGWARHAWFDVYELDLGFLGEYYFTTVLLSDVPDACDGLEALTDALSEGDCEEVCEELAVVADTYTGFGDSWYALLGALEEDESDIVGTYEYDPGQVEGAFSASFTRFSLGISADPSECEDACEDGDDLLASDDEGGENGELVIESYERGSRLTGEFEVGFGGDDYLNGAFDAQPCDLN